MTPEPKRHARKVSRRHASPPPPIVSRRAWALYRLGCGHATLRDAMVHLALQRATS